MKLTTSPAQRPDFGKRTKVAIKSGKQRETSNDLFLRLWEEHGFDGSDITTEYRFHPVRKWRFDIAFPSAKVAVEIDGFGIGGMGRHQNPAALVSQNEKQNEAVRAGWTLLRVAPTTLKSADKRDDFFDILCEVLVDRLRAVSPLDLDPTEDDEEDYDQDEAFEE